MKKLFGFNLKYFIMFLILFATEIFIALFVKDKIIRPFVGDILVMLLMYTFIRSVLVKQIKRLPVYLFVFAVAVEISQYFKLVEVLGLSNNKFIAVIMGTSFDIKDIACYLAGSIILIVWEMKCKVHK